MIDIWAERLLLTGIIYLLLGGLINTAKLAYGSKPKLFRFKFSLLSYHLFLAPWAIGLVVASYRSNNFTDLYLFLIFALAGVIGETAFSLSWDVMFPKRFWFYRVQTLFNGYTSLLNFIPWGLGGLLFMLVVNFFALPYNNPASGYQLVGSAIHPLVQFWIVYTLIGLAVYFGRSFYLLLTSGSNKIEFKTVSHVTYLIYCLPFIISLTYLVLFVAKNYFLIAAAMGIVAFIAEYTFGKACRIFVSRKLWDYAYFTFDNHHGTPLAIIPFSMAGFYFWSWQQLYSAYPQLSAMLSLLAALGLTIVVIYLQLLKRWQHQHDRTQNNQTK